MMATTAKQPPRLSVQAFWLAASKLVAALLSIGLPVLLVRLMSQTEYGVYKEAFLFAGTATNMATFGMGMSAYYFMPRFPERGGQIALNILVYNFIAGWVPLIVLAAYPGILERLFRTTDLQPLAIPLGILVFFTLTSVLIQHIPTAMQDVRWSTIFIVGTQLTKVIVLAATALTFRSVESLIIAFTLHQFVSLLFLFWYLHGKFPRFWTHFDWAFFKEQLAYALPYGALGLLWVVQRDLDNYFVSAMLGPRDYAIYAVGWLDVPLISLLLESAGPVMIVRVSKLQQENRKADIRSVTAAATSHMAAIQYPLFMLLLVAGHDLIVLLYTRAYERSADIFLISILLLPLDVLLFDPIARAYKNLRNFALGLRIAVFITLLCCSLSRGPSFRNDRRRHHGGGDPDDRARHYRLEGGAGGGRQCEGPCAVSRFLQSVRRNHSRRSRRIPGPQSDKPTSPDCADCGRRGLRYGGLPGGGVRLPLTGTGAAVERAAPVLVAVNPCTLERHNRLMTAWLPLNYFTGVDLNFR